MNSLHFLSENERILGEAALLFAADTARRADNTDQNWRAYWPNLVEQGWLGVLATAEEGGFGGSLADLLLLARALGSEALRAPFLSSAALTTPMLTRAKPNQRAHWMPEVIAGRARLALAHEETSRDPAGIRLKTRAKRNEDGNGYVLTGAKRMVLYGDDADALIVSALVRKAASSEGIGTFLVSRDAPGLHSVSYRLIDGTEAANFVFDDVLVVDGTRVGALEDDARATLDEAVLNGALAATGEAIGCLEGALAQTVEHLLTRKQFNAPLATFQVLRHRIADMYIAVEELRSLAFAAAKSVDRTERERAIRATKIHLGHAGVWVAEQAVQLHGAMGITEDCKAGQFLKRVTVLDRLFGGADHHIALMSAELLSANHS